MERLTHLILMLLFGMAGCLDAGTGSSPEPSTEATPLSELAECDFSYPDGSPIPCEAVLRGLEGSAALPEGQWVCTHEERLDRMDVRFYREALREDRIALEVNHEASDVLHLNVILVREGGDREYAVARVPPGGHIMEWPTPPGQLQGIWIGLLDIDVVTNITALTGAAYMPLWSVFGDSFFLVHQLVLPDETYHAHAHRPSMANAGVVQPWQGYGSVGFNLTEGNLKILIDAYVSHQSGGPYVWDLRTPDPECHAFAQLGEMPKAGAPASPGAGPLDPPRAA